MIRSFADRETELIYHGRQSRRLPPDIQRAGHRKLLMLAAAATLADLRQPPSNRLEKLRGDRHDQWSIRINDRWRICFRWRDRGAEHVEITDYH
jgi:proteic killer suppression protein